MYATVLFGLTKLDVKRNELRKMKSNAVVSLHLPVGCLALCIEQRINDIIVIPVTILFISM